MLFSLSSYFLFKCFLNGRKICRKCLWSRYFKIRTERLIKMKYNDSKMKQKCFNLITQSGWSFTKVLELCLFCQRNSKRRIKSVSLGFLRLKSPETVAVGHRDEHRRDVLRALWVLNHWARFLSLVAPLRPPSDLSYLSVSKTEIDGNVFFAVKMKGCMVNSN